MMRNSEETDSEDVGTEEKFSCHETPKSGENITWSTISLSRSIYRLPQYQSNTILMVSIALKYSAAVNSGRTKFRTNKVSDRVLRRTFCPKLFELNIISYH